MANVIIKRSKRDEYLACGGWTPIEEAAMVFPSSLQALDFCWRQRLHEVVIVIRFPDPRLNSVWQKTCTSLLLVHVFIEQPARMFV